MLLLLNICVHCANKASSDFKDRNKIDKDASMLMKCVSLPGPGAPQEARAGGKHACSARVQPPTTEACCTNNFAKKTCVLKTIGPVSK